jgi:hypothetical protein
VFVWTYVAEQLPSSFEAVLWWINLLALGIIVFVPFFKWVIGADFKFNGQGLTLREQWLALPVKYSRMGVWLMSVCLVEATLSALARVFFK